MANINGEWIMIGLDKNDPGRIHSPDEAIKFIDEIGFLPLFANSVQGFSLEEHTVPEYWWSGDEDNDPWEWRTVIAESGKVAYGKFFDGKAGFISLRWFPYFANWRRDGYDFDALWDDGKAKQREKLIMDCFEEKDSYYSNELKSKVCLFPKSNWFDPEVGSLQKKTYLVIREFRRKINKKGIPYGWHIGIYSTPEAIWGYDMVTSAYSEDPEKSKERIYARIREVFPFASDEMINRIMK